MNRKHIVVPQLEIDTAASALKTETIGSTSDTIPLPKIDPKDTDIWRLYKQIFNFYQLLGHVFGCKIG